MLDLETRIEYAEAIEDVVQMKTKDVEEENAALFLSKLFSKACKEYIGAIKKENEWQMFTCAKNFREYSCFVKKDSVVIYIHFSDYLFWDYQNVMYKVAKHSNDIAGENCHYCDIIDLEESIVNLFNEELQARKSVCYD